MFLPAFPSERKVILCCVQVPTDNVLHLEAPALVKAFPGVELRMRKLDADPSTFEINEETFKNCASLVEECAKKMVTPEEARSATVVIGLSCTSMSFTIGAKSVDEMLQRACPGARTTDMARAQLDAVRALRLAKVSLLTPYVESISAANAGMLSEVTSVVRRHTLNLNHDDLTTAVEPESIAGYSLDVDCSDSEGLVIGCSAFRACGPGFIDDLELSLGKPVVTSTQAFLWGMLRAGGVVEESTGYGRLLRTARNLDYKCGREISITRETSCPPREEVTSPEFNCKKSHFEPPSLSLDPFGFAPCARFLSG